MMGWGGVGHANVRVNLLRFFDSLLQDVAMEIHPHVQKLGESHGVKTARDVKMTVRTAEHA